MKALKYILFLLLIAIIGIAIYIAVQPNTFEVIRSRNIKAPVSVIFDKVNDLKNWESWSSWSESDPDMRIILSDKTKGEGGAYSWEDKDGVGTMKITESVPYELIKQEMQFADFPPSEIGWSFEPNKDNSTKVTWYILGKNLPFGFKAYAAFTGGMEKQIGPHYERSLEKLDSIVQADMKKYSITLDGITQHGGGYYLYKTASCKISEIETKISETLSTVGRYALENHINIAGAPFVNYLKWDEDNNATIFSCCFPTTEKVITEPKSDILTGQLQPFDAVKTTLKGDYKNLKEAWDTTMNYISRHNLDFVENGPMMEVYITDPKNTSNPANWVTDIYIAVKRP